MALCVPLAIYYNTPEQESTKQKSTTKEPAKEF